MNTEEHINSQEQVSQLIKRTFMFLEDGEWKNASDYCERILDMDPENAQAYLCKLLAEMRKNNKSQLANCERSFEENPNYKKIVRFADEELKEELNGYLLTIKERQEAKRAEEQAAIKMAEENERKRQEAYKEYLEKYPLAEHYDELTRRRDQLAKSNSAGRKGYKFFLFFAIFATLLSFGMGIFITSQKEMTGNFFSHFISESYKVSPIYIVLYGLSLIFLIIIVALGIPVFKNAKRIDEQIKSIDETLEAIKKIPPFEG